MRNGRYLEIVNDPPGTFRERSEPAAAQCRALRAAAAEWAAALVSLPLADASSAIRKRVKLLRSALLPLLNNLEVPSQSSPVGEDFRWVHDHIRLIYALLDDLKDLPRSFTRAPHVHTPGGAMVPRVVALAHNFLSAAEFQFVEEGFAAYVDAFQEAVVLNIDELRALVPVLKLILLERIAQLVPQLSATPDRPLGLDVCVQSLCEIGETNWQEFLEPLVLFDGILRKDPAGDYAAMDFETRERYRGVIAEVSAGSDVSEMDVAIQVLFLAQEAQQHSPQDSRAAIRCSHVGYYLVGEGFDELRRNIGFRPPFKRRFQAFLRRNPSQYYLSGIALLTMALVSSVLLLVGVGKASAGLIALAVLALLLPCSQAAVELMNYLTARLLPAQGLPKLDFLEGIPSDCVTVVAVPTLLLNETQVRNLVEKLEVHYLANRDRNLHFALLTDLPDSLTPADENDPLVHLCADLVRRLNKKYRGQGLGSFFLFHRHRVFNPAESVWMGWERKRGKLLDFNKLLRSEYDSFPVKAGNLSLLSAVRYVITLDADTELPRRSAQRLVGTIAHPLNRAVIDSEKNIVTAGYGVLQPRVSVSVNSATSSRLASIYSGQTGLDPYTRAISDVYQDLFGEGIFAGKGIYEVDSFHQVLDSRFPRNSLLSHDLIEGAYTRAGLVSDIEIIDDYPSHYSAYNRRKHRWLRGDWQIIEWLLPSVPDEAGNRVRNPISLISRWKILDNVRRSLVEPSVFLLLLLGWLLLPGKALAWTFATVGILLAPAFCQCTVDLVAAAVQRKKVIANDAFRGLFSAAVNVWLSVTFLLHQTLLSLDAIVRTCVRRVVTRKRLLEWETAAQAELGVRRTQLDRYLDWTPLLVIGLGVSLAFLRPIVLPTALPLLALWASSKLIPTWLNRAPNAEGAEVPARDERFLRGIALRTWHYFDSFSTREHNWLVPDNVQETPAAVAARVSPTNIGLLLNARQVACELGYLTLPEFQAQTAGTLKTVAQLQRHRGHLFNWYSTRDLSPLAPLFISTVDSGNLVASLWSLQQGSMEQLRRPLLSPASAEGLLDHVLALWSDLQPSPEFLAFERQISAESWLEAVLRLPDSFLDEVAPPVSSRPSDVEWFSSGARLRVAEIKATVRAYLPWLLPEFALLRHDPVLRLPAHNSHSLESLPAVIEFLSVRVSSVLSSTPMAPDRILLCESLQELLAQAHQNATELIHNIRAVADHAALLADEMDFGFLLNRRRKLLSVGFDVAAGRLHPSCYDLLASEARMATFVAIAKEEIPQEAWFLLGRAHTLSDGRPVLLSWTGTMFEYLMPSLWMRSYPNTLLDRSRKTAVYVQQAYAARHKVPWGISESAYFDFDGEGNYQYAAFGVPGLGLKQQTTERLVISPYSTLLALDVDVLEAVRNMHSMVRLGWLGTYGFYEAADFTGSLGQSRPGYERVACWMAHHQGMSLLALGNFLRDRVVERWFHSNPYVQATELLLQEKPVRNVKPLRPRSAAA